MRPTWNRPMDVVVILTMKRLDKKHYQKCIVQGVGRLSCNRQSTDTQSQMNIFRSETIKRASNGPIASQVVQAWRCWMMVVTMPAGRYIYVCTLLVQMCNIVWWRMANGLAKPSTFTCDAIYKNGKAHRSSANLLHIWPSSSMVTWTYEYLWDRLIRWRWMREPVG
jgi:hypothetical protein